MKTAAIVFAVLAISASAGPVAKLGNLAARDPLRTFAGRARSTEHRHLSRSKVNARGQKKDGGNTAATTKCQNGGQNAGQNGADSGGAVAANSTAGGAAVLPDGRIPQDATPENFNVLASPFKSAVVKGDGLQFSDIIAFPGTTPSPFDTAGNTKAFSVSINDASIFVPGGAGGTPQDQFRRAELLPSIASTLNDVAVTGKKTMHFSMQQDATKPLALATNEYQLAFLETADFANRQFDVRTGTGTTSPSLTGQNMVVLGRSGANITEMFVTPNTPDLQNFAITLDFDQNTMQVFHSTGQDPLQAVTQPVANDNSGQGEYHFGIVKQPDANGQQAANIDEINIYSGIFMEDSADGTVTLQG